MRALRRMLTWVTVVLGLLYLAVCAGMYVWQRSLLYFPQPAHRATEKITLESRGDGERIAVSVRRKASGAPALLYFGGNADDVSTKLPRLAHLFPEHALYLMHYRGYGPSTGAPTEAGLHADARALYARVKAEHAVVHVVGRSLGSGVAARLASEQAVDRLVLVTPYDSVENVGVDQYPWLPVRWLIRDRFDSAAVAGRISAPTTLLIAQHDTLIRPERSAQLAQAFQSGVARSVEITGTDHNSISGSPEYERALVTALR